MKDGKYVLGLMKPSTLGRGTGAVELQKMLPPDVTVASVALGIGDLVASQLSAALARIEEAAGELVARNVDVITMGGTPPVVFGGYGFDRTIIERIGRITAVPATTSQTSAVDAIRLLGVRKIVIVTPFKDAINDLIIRFMNASGFEIGRLETADAPFAEFPKIPPSLSFELALKAVRAARDAQCIWIPCSAWPVSENIEPLEAETGLPVVASTQSEVWGALRLMGIKTPIPGFGRLLREF